MLNKQIISTKILYKIIFLSCIIFSGFFLNNAQTQDYYNNSEINAITSSTEQKSLSKSYYPSLLNTNNNMTKSFSFNLLETIQTLQILANISSQTSFSIDYDINNDSKIGLQEVIYIMKNLYQDQSNTESKQIILNGNAITTVGQGITVAFSSPKLISGSKYNVYLGGSSTGTAIDGLYQNGSYTPGNLYQSFTIY